MTRGYIDKKTLEDQLPAILQEQLREDGFDANHLPSWDYITANTRYTAEGLNNKTNELYDKTLIQFLQSQGFGTREMSKWPTNDEDTVVSLNYFIQALEDKRGWKENTIISVESAINKVYEAIMSQGYDIDILYLGYYNSEPERVENIQITISVLEYMNNQLSDGTMINYSTYFSKYYKFVKNRFPIDLNPVEEASAEFKWKRNVKNPDPLTQEQLNDLWNTLGALKECPIQGYDLEHWRMRMKMLLIFLIAVGPRSNEVVRLDLREQVHFGQDPHVYFSERKNLESDVAPQKVPIMWGESYLRAYRDWIEVNSENGKLIPSDESATGSRVANTLNRWLKEICRKADVRLDDGSIPTIQNIRQFWKMYYRRALYENRAEIQFVSQEDGKQFESDEKNYIPDVENRKHVRSIGRKYFEGIIDIGDLPAPIQENLDQNDYIDRQSDLSEY